MHAAIGKGRTEPRRGTRTPRRRAAVGLTGPERIRIRAYEIFRDRMVNGAPGDDLSDWLQAERELTAAAGAAARDASAPVVWPRAADPEADARIRGEILLHGVE